jgi:hypothetical protein
MPPKKDEAPKPKKKAELPKELCGCGVNTYVAPPKGKKKKVVIIEHRPDCTFQRATCNRYPHLPKCSVCEDICAYCSGINYWCPHCMDNRCLFRYKRDVLGWGGKKDDAAGRPSTTADMNATMSVPPSAAGGPKK